MKSLTAFKTEDGKIFQDKKEAELHEAKLSLIKILDNDRILGTYAGSYAEPHAVLDWLHAYEDEVIKYLKLKKEK